MYFSKMPTVPSLSIGKETGIIFHSQFPGSFCFVPERCVSSRGASFSVDQGLYVVSDWSRRNLFLQPNCGAGAQLFPDETEPVTDLTTPEIADFITRARRWTAQRA